MAGEITLNPALVQKIQSYFDDPVYRETIENAAQYNSRLGSERTMRLPFLDSQTGVAQNHSNLFMEPNQRIPGLKEGQIYSYPSKRWQKKRRQYLSNFMQPRLHLRKDPPPDIEPMMNIGSSLAIENSPFPPVSISGPSNIMSNPTSGPGEIIGPSSSSAALPPPPGPPEEPKETPTKNSHPELTKQDWYYDELDVPDAGEFDEPDADSDYDYEESYSSKRKKKKTPAKTPRQNKTKRKITYDAVTDPDKPFACDLCGARYKTRPGLTYHYTHSHKEKEDDEEEGGELIPSSPKRGDEGPRRRSGMPPPVLHPQQPLGLQPPTLQPQQPMPHHMGMGGMPPPGMMHHSQHHPPPPHLIPQQQPPHMAPHQVQPMYHHQPPPGTGMPPPPGAYLPGHMQHPQGHMPPHQQHPSHMQGPPRPPSNGGNPGCPPNQPPPMMQGMQGPPHMSGGPPLPAPPENNHPIDDPNYPKKHDSGKPRVQPSPYCDFCLGDATENKKSGTPEELVSCSDCGRSGHPTCLQFTANMIISVKKYRWQCIECKCCSICGTSDNDDQLLFCDDCDRGYHMYCLTPALDAPPEGSWSCTLCISEFHKK